MKRVTLRTSELFKAPTPPTLVEGLINRHGVVGLSADPGVGKTFVAMEIARCVAMKEPFLGRFEVKRRGAILFVGQDCDLLEYAQQARKVFARYDRPFDEIRWLVHAGLDLKRTKDLSRLIEIARTVPDPNFDPDVPVDWEVTPPENEPNADAIDCTWEPIYGDPCAVSMIVLDSARDMHTANENDNGEMSAFFTNLRLLARETKSVVIVVHHHGYASETNPGNRFRGASSQLAALTGWLELSGQGVEKTVRIRKFRGIRPADFKFKMSTSETDVQFEFVGEIDSKLGSTSTPQPYLSAGEQEVYEFVKNFIASEPTGSNRGEINYWDIVTHLKKRLNRSSAESTASKYMAKLTEKKLVTKSRKGTWALIV